MKVVENYGNLISTSWGQFFIGETVIFSEEAKENENYEHFLNYTLEITWADLEDGGLGAEEPIMCFIVKETGVELPFSLYGYEIAKVK